MLSPNAGAVFSAAAYGMPPAERAPSCLGAPFSGVIAYYARTCGEPFARWPLAHLATVAPIERCPCASTNYDKKVSEPTRSSIPPPPARPPPPLSLHNLSPNRPSHTLVHLILTSLAGLLPPILPLSSNQPISGLGRKQEISPSIPSQPQPQPAIRV